MWLSAFTYIGDMSMYNECKQIANNYWLHSRTSFSYDSGDRAGKGWMNKILKSTVWTVVAAQHWIHITGFLNWGSINLIESVH